MSKAMSKILMMALMFSSFGIDNNATDTISYLTDEELEELKRSKQEAKRKRMLAKGLKEFNIKGYTIVALNEKNAIRKIKNLEIKLIEFNTKS